MLNLTRRVLLYPAVLVLLCAAMPAQKLKVYILCGQSNMEGHAKGCAKTMAQIGVAFADGLLRLQRQ